MTTHSILMLYAFFNTLMNHITKQKIILTGNWTLVSVSKDGFFCHPCTEVMYDFVWVNCDRTVISGWTIPLNAALYYNHKQKGQQLFILHLDQTRAYQWNISHIAFVIDHSLSVKESGRVKEEDCNMRREGQTEQFSLLLMFVNSVWKKVCTSLLTNAF